MSPVSSKHQRDNRETKAKKLVKKPKCNVFSMEEGPGIETHPTGGARSCYHGINFERELTMLWTYRAYRTGREFTVAIEDERTGKFDDYFINIKLDDGTILQQFVQLKHSSQKVPKLTCLDLFPKVKKVRTSSSKNVFDLKLFFKSFLDIKNCSEFDVVEKSKERFILFTNRMLTFGGKIGEFEFCENMFEKERDNEILNADLLKFKSEFPGRESLKNLLSTNVNDLEHVNNFLEHFYIAESQPDGHKVSQLLKSELYSDFNEMHCENAYNKIYTEYLEWYKATESNKGTRLSHVAINKYFSEIKHHVVEQTSFELMDPTANFYGREDVIAKIRTHLTTIPKSTSHVIDVSILGMSGVGKTEIVRYYAKLYRFEYDYTLWLNASSQQTLDASFERLQKFLNIKDNDELNKKHGNIELNEKEISQDRIKRIYSFLENHKCLIIFDSEFKFLKQELQYDKRQYLPFTKSNDHHVIVTTQIQNLPSKFEIQVDNFSKQETLGFLKQNIDSNLYNNDFELIALGKVLSNVILALQIATSYIKENNRQYQIFGKSYSVQNFLAQYKKESSSVLNYKSEDLANKSLITLCELSIQSIVNSKENVRHLALQILYIIAHLQPDHISVKIFDSGKHSTEDLSKAILILKMHSLINISSGHISIHRLTQDILRAKLQQVSEKMKTDNEIFFYVDGRGQALHKNNKEMIESGTYNKEYILLTGLSMFQNAFNTLKYSQEVEDILTRNIIVTHSTTFIITHCIKNSYLVYGYLNFILSVFNFVNQYETCLECIECLIYISYNIKHYATVNDMETAIFQIKSSLVQKYLQVGDIHRGIKVSLECQNILNYFQIPFIYTLQLSLDTITLLKIANQNKESFQLLLKLYILFNDYTNFKNQKLSPDQIKNACILATLLEEQLKFDEATQVFETIYQHESYTCENNLVPNKKNCSCVGIAISLSSLYSLQNKLFRAKELMLSAQKCIKVPSKPNEMQNFSTFFHLLCYLHYKCDSTSKSFSVLNELSNIQFPALEVSDSTIRFKAMLASLTANYFVINKRCENAIDVILSAIYGLLVIYKRFNILNYSQRIEFAVNDIILNKIAVNHNQAPEFQLLLFNAIHLSYVHFGFEYALANLLKIEKSVLDHFGQTTEINSYILMCRSSLYKREKRHILEIQTWIEILQLWYRLAKDTFVMFRIMLGKFLDETHLENYFNSVNAKQLLGIIELAIHDAEKSSSLEHKIDTFILKFLHLQCLFLTKKYSSAEKNGFQFLSSTILDATQNSINIICEVHVKLALHFYKIKKNPSKAIKILNKCIFKLRNFDLNAGKNILSLKMTNAFYPVELCVSPTTKETINELALIQRVLCCIEKSKIYYKIGDFSKGWDTLHDCMYKIHDFDISNASFIPTIKKILLHLLEVDEKEKALHYINNNCKLDDDKLDLSGACEILRIKAKLQFELEKKANAVKTLWELWNKKLIIVSNTNIHSYRNIEFLDQIKSILLKLEYQLSLYIIDNSSIRSVKNLYFKEPAINLEMTFYIAFCNYLLGNYNECMRAIKSVEKLLKCSCNLNNEEYDNIVLDTSVLKQYCNICLTGM